MPRRRSLSGLLLLSLVACGPPREAEFEPSQRAQTAPPPRLAPTAMFDTALARAGPDTLRIEAESAALAARAEALAARAEALSGPVVDDDARPRLEPRGADG